MKNRNALLAALVFILIVAGIGCGSAFASSKSKQECRDRGGIVVVGGGPKTNSWHCEEKP